MSDTPGGYEFILTGEALRALVVTFIVTVVMSAGLQFVAAGDFSGVPDVQAFALGLAVAAVQAGVAAVVAALTPGAKFSLNGGR